MTLEHEGCQLVFFFNCFLFFFFWKHMPSAFQIYIYISKSDFSSKSAPPTSLNIGHFWFVLAYMTWPDQKHPLRRLVAHFLMKSWILRYIFFWKAEGIYFQKKKLKKITNWQPSFSYVKIANHEYFDYFGL